MKLVLTTVTCMPRVSIYQEVLNVVAEKDGLEMALNVLVSIQKKKLFSLFLSLSLFFFFLMKACIVTVITPLEIKYCSSICCYLWIDGYARLFCSRALVF